jgi:outer membrane protein insertion porin family
MRRIMFAGLLSIGLFSGRLQAQLTSLPDFDPVIDNRIPADSVGDDNVVAIEIEGNRQVSDREIIRMIDTRIDRPYDQDMIQEDVRALTETGAFVYVRPTWRRVDGGRIVTFEVLERHLTLYVQITGNNVITKKKLLEEAGIQTGEPLSNYDVIEAKRKIESFYRTKGFSSAYVTVLEGEGLSDQGVVFMVNEGRRQRIQDIDFMGNEIAVDARLLSEIASKPPFLARLHQGLVPDIFFGGMVDLDIIDADIESLKSYYYSLGFFRCRIGRVVEPVNTPSMSTAPGERDDIFLTSAFAQPSLDDWIRLTFVIDEGPRYQVQNIRVNGNSHYSDAEIMGDFQLEEGEFYSQRLLDMDRASIAEKYGRVGYIFSETRVIPYLEETPGRLDIVFEINEGRRCRAGKIDINILGEVTDTKETTIRNRLSIWPGDIINLEELRASERRLRASGLFETNPAMGQLPQIVFTPPAEMIQSEEEETQIAEGPHGYRGQNRGSFSNEMIVDLAIVGTLRDAVPAHAPQYSSPVPAATPRPRTPAPVYRQQPIPTSQLPAPRIQTPQIPRPQIPSPTSPVAPRSRPVAQPYIIRGQFQVPSLGRPNSARPTATPPPLPYQPTPRNVNVWDRANPTPSPAPVNPPVTQPRAPIQNPQPSEASSGSFGSVQSYGGLGQRLDRAYGSAPPTETSAGYQSSYQGPSQVTSGTYRPPQPNAAEWIMHDPPSDYFATRNGLQPWSVAYPRDTQLLPGNNAVEDAGVLMGRNPTDDPSISVPLITNVQEARTGTLNMSFGVSSDSGLIGNFVLTERDFDITRWPRSFTRDEWSRAFKGGGQTFRIEASPGSRVSRYMFNFSEPYLLGSDIQMGIDAHYYGRYYSEWDEQRVGGKVSFGYQWTKDFVTGFSVRGDEVKLRNPVVPTPPTLMEALGTSTLVGLRLHASYDKRDNRYFPTSGYFVSGGVEQVVGTYSYPRFDFDARYYKTITSQPDGLGAHVLGLRATVGITGDDTPIYEHYFAGGSQTLRGFDYRTASPREGGQVVGGHFSLMTSAEYIFPLSQGKETPLRGILFCDAGVVQPDISNWDDRFRVAPGFGLRIQAPFLGEAPIALDFAFPISTEDSDEEAVFTFFVGFLK